MNYSMSFTRRGLVAAFALFCWGADVAAQQPYQPARTPAQAGRDQLTVTASPIRANLRL